MSDDDSLLVEHQRPAVWALTVNRPARSNALDPPMISRLIAWLDDATTREDIRVVLLLGRGKHFCAGADLASDHARSPTGGGYSIVHLLERLLQRNIIPDSLTDQTSAHDPLIGYWPHQISVEQAKVLREENPEQYLEYAYDSMYQHVSLMLELQKRGAVTFDYGNNIRARAKERGLQNAFDFPGFVPAYIRPLFCEGKGPFRWVALSGDPKDIHTTDEVIASLFPENTSLQRWLKLAKEKIQFQGLPARICWLGQGEREKAGLAFNELVRTRKVAAPIVIGRDHLDTGSVASPNRETEAMLDGSDAVADWPILNALMNTAGGASWVSLHHGGGVGMGYSIHAGMVIVADGTDAAAERLSRVLRNDPGLGVIRHADAGYEIAKETAKNAGLDLKDKLQ